MDKLVVNPNTGEVFYLDNANQQMLGIDGAQWDSSLCSGWDEVELYRNLEGYSDWKSTPDWYIERPVFVRGVFRNADGVNCLVWGEYSRLMGKVGKGEKFTVTAVFVHRHKCEDPTWWGRPADQTYRRLP